MDTPYEIPNLENQKNDVGTSQKPFFYHITTGKFIKKSAVFHAQIQRKYHEYHIRTINSETLNLVCVDKSCPARALLKVPKSSGLITVRRTKTMAIFCEENNFDDPVHLCNFATKFANYDETASVFEPQLQLTVL